eukprot:scaffold117942_cov36-Phaeocystis_antarctica.AAC.1
MAQSRKHPGRPGATKGPQGATEVLVVRAELKGSVLGARRWRRSHGWEGEGWWLSTQSPRLDGGGGLSSEFRGRGQANAGWLASNGLVSR